MTEGNNLDPPKFIPNPPLSYPADVLTLLAGRYTTQRLSVLDEGVPGEKVSEGRFRLPRVLTSDRPDALLLLEGVNDLNENGVDGITRAIDRPASRWYATPATTASWCSWPPYHRSVRAHFGRIHRPSSSR